MARLENIAVGSKVKGITGDKPVTVTEVRWQGTAALEVAYRDGRGAAGSRVLKRTDEAEIEVLDSRLSLSFDADGEDMKLASEAYRIRLAHFFDPYLAVHTSSVDPLPHQIQAVYKEMLPRIPLRYVLADDPGAGKTVMTGLYIKEMMARGDLKRCLIVCPGSLAEQWQDELDTKFHLHFSLLDNDMIRAAGDGNVFAGKDFLCIARLDKLARNMELREQLKMTDWDLIVCDEAHKMSATVSGWDIKRTKRYELGELLSSIARNFLLLTATPHNGKNEDYMLFLALVDPDRFEGAVSIKDRGSVPDTSDIMRRYTKEEMKKFDGTPLFPKREAHTVAYMLSPDEAKLYHDVTKYVQTEFNRADRLEGSRRTAVGFALTILQRRLASSPEAIYQSLKRRKEQLEQRLIEEKNRKQNEPRLRKPKDFGVLYDFDNESWLRNPKGFGLLDDFDEDDLNAGEQEEFENDILVGASAAATMEELRAEIETLKGLEEEAGNLLESHKDVKWNELSGLLQSDDMKRKDGQREKLIIFTEHRDTLNYLEGRIKSLLGDGRAVVTIHGGMTMRERKQIEEIFRQDADVQILIATDAAGEGINLQCAHLMINYDLPWNPNRIEQRFGRIHRIGQTETCYLWNLVAKDTREGAVFQKLFEKLEEEQKALGGKVFDILGKLKFGDRPLSELLIQAIRSDSESESKRLVQTVDRSMDREALQKLINEQALSEEMSRDQMGQIREEMERMEAHKLQPYFIESFFLKAFKKLNGSIRRQGRGRYKITWVPSELRSRSGQSDGRVILKSYENVCFDKQYCNVQGQHQAELLCPGHPLLDAVIDLVLEKYSGCLEQGALFIDERDDSTDARLLFYIEDSIQDGVRMPDGSRRIISREVQFVELQEDGSAVNAGSVPYLDYRAARSEEEAEIRSWMKDQAWLSGNVEETARNYAEQKLLPEYFSRIKDQRNQSLNKTKNAVRIQLTKEIQYWYEQSEDLEKKEKEGKPNPRKTSARAARRAKELQERQKERYREIEIERQIEAQPPVITSGALVIPRGLLKQLMGTATEADRKNAQARKAVEVAAMEAVMKIERNLGFQPKDVSKENCGYDIESRIPDAEDRHLSSSLRMIEVKGRAKGADTVTVTRNEILVALNRQDDGRDYLLALVEVDGDSVSTTYLKNCFRNTPDRAVESQTYNIKQLISCSEVVYP